MDTTYNTPRTAEEWKHNRERVEGGDKTAQWLASDIHIHKATGVVKAQMPH